MPSVRKRRPTQLRWSSKTTWIGTLAVVLAVGVAALTSVSSQRMIRDVEAALRSRIATYGTVLAGQLGPAIAHGDRAAASGILSVLAADTEVTAVTLRGANGAELYRHGTPGWWPPESITAPEVFDSGDRIAAAVPVVAPGGGRGLLTLELSTDELRGYRRSAAWAAIAAGTAALIFGVFARRVIARSVVGRLRALIDVESASQHAPGAPAVRQQPHDEVGILGDAFHHVFARLRADQVRLRTTVSELMVVKDELARTNGELEQRVAQRTSELSAANRQLQLEVTQRSQIEVELRQAQKLESVGRLASGIAHEINTPVQFVSDSCSFLETATEDLIAVIAAYRTELDANELASTSAAAHMHEVEAERDIAYLIEQIPLAIHRALGGLQRVSGIVHAMKEFAYPDHKEQAPADLNRAILSTLTVARNEYKYVAEVKTELADLPLVTCHIGELNQVILNMVVNSAHAIATAKAEHERDGLIVIRTRLRGAQIELEIEDNGCGIPESAIDKIFDPFFTTKEIGKGTGQGLAIARAVVVDKHAGKIDVSSRVGSGTTFAITLPLLGRSPHELDAASGSAAPPIEPDIATPSGPGPGPGAGAGLERA